MALGKQPTEILREEHENVLQKLEALENTVKHLDGHDEFSVKLEELASFFATDFWVHFAKEEEALFPELETFIPRGGGPLDIMYMEHEDLRNINATLQQAIKRYLENLNSVASRAAIQGQSSQFAGILRDHIHKENNILFMMADMHLGPAQNEKIVSVFSEIETKRN
ncbi:MAG: hemerythrin domain-containing protein [Chloroflexi bacterium]|nr:hemerythrin domain-containing protein [Chloroflexota bacterium]